jgi:hypothetical protein
MQSCPEVLSTEGLQMYLLQISHYSLDLMIYCRYKSIVNIDKQQYRYIITNNFTYSHASMQTRAHTKSKVLEIKVKDVSKICISLTYTNIWHDKPL